jgi:imidazolonepropionase-like amidohydrolase
VLPGLIDCHTHLIGDAQASDILAPLEHSEAQEALTGVRNARATLLAGFTSVRDVGTYRAFVDAALRDAINDGLVEGPRMLVATRAIAAVGQYNPFGVSPDLTDFPHGAQMVSGVEEARRAAREQIGNGADLIKVYADWDYPTLTVEELRVVVEEAHKAGRRVAAHATTDEGIRRAVTAGVATIEHGTGATDELLALMRERKVVLCPTLAASEAIARYAGWKGGEPEPERVRESRAMFARALASGVTIAAGNDGGTPFNPSEDLVTELRLMVDYGMSPLAAIGAATLGSAQALDLSEETGTIQPGKRADCLVLDKGADPLGDITSLSRVWMVIKQGNIVYNSV